MTDSFAIQIEPARAMNAAQECAVIRQAAKERAPSPAVRQRLATLLNQLDAFDEAVALLGAVPKDALSHDEARLLSHAHFSLGGPEDAAASLAAARHAFASAASDAQRSSSLADQARALFRLDRAAEAVEVLHAALRSDPHHAEAVKRLVNHLLLTSQAAAALHVTGDLASRGVNHVQLTALRALTMVRAGQPDAARPLLGLDRFVTQSLLEPPPGWDSLAAFNAALAAELAAHPALRFERHGMASVRTWRIDSLVAGGGPLARALLDRIIAAVAQHVVALSSSDHAWIAARPHQALLKSWCVITEGPGYEEWHMHPGGWLSGVYYVQVPETVSAGAGTDGCLVLGVPDTPPGADAAGLEDHIVRPRPGLVATFPSHAYHRTFPHGGTAKRICVAFDVQPA